MNQRLTVLALLSVALGAALLVAGVYDLAGRGWALVAGAAVSSAIGVVILRGLIHAE